MKNGYDHHVHQDIYTYNLSVPRRFILDVPNQSPPYFNSFYTNWKSNIQEETGQKQMRTASNIFPDPHLYRSEAESDVYR